MVNRIGLFVDCAAGTVSGTISGLAPGPHTFELRYTLLVDSVGGLPEILIATAVTTGDIASAQNTPIAFAPAPGLPG
jgi:TctA family transporter